MTNRKVILAALVASAFQMIFEGIWYIKFFQGIAEANLGCIMRKNPFLPLNFINELALSLIIVLALRYQKRITISKGVEVGIVIGLLTGLNQFVNWYVNFKISALYFSTEVIKNVLLGAGSGLIASLFAERQKVKAYFF